jgi:hypothetical protein
MNCVTLIKKFKTICQGKLKSEHENHKFQPQVYIFFQHTRQVSFLTGKCEPLGEIVPSHILEHD